MTRRVWIGGVLALTSIIVISVFAFSWGPKRLAFCSLQEINPWAWVRTEAIATFSDGTTILGSPDCPSFFLTLDERWWLSRFDREYIELEGEVSAAGACRLIGPKYLIEIHGLLAPPVIVGEVNSFKGQDLLTYELQGYFSSELDVCDGRGYPIHSSKREEIPLDLQ